MENQQNANGTMSKEQEKDHEKQVCALEGLQMKRR